MNKNKKTQNGFGLVVLLAAIVLAAGVTSVGFYVLNNNTSKKSSSSVEGKTSTKLPENASSPTPTVQKVTEAKPTYNSEDLIKAANSHSTCTKAGALPKEDLTRPITSDGWAELGSGCIDSTTKQRLAGGALMVWHYSDGSWQFKSSWQGGPYCSMIDKNKISSQLYPFCIIDESITWPKYIPSASEWADLTSKFESSYSIEGPGNSNWAKNPIE